MATKTTAKVKQTREFNAIYTEAHVAGTAAATKHQPRPMTVGSAHPLGMGDGIDYSKPTYYVPEGVCGFAWISVRPGTSAFARWLTKSGQGRRDDYAGEVCIWVHQFNQSMERKEKYADAFAEVLRKYGIKAYSDSRMD